MALTDDIVINCIYMLFSSVTTFKLFVVLIPFKLHVPSVKFSRRFALQDCLTDIPMGEIETITLNFNSLYILGFSLCTISSGVQENFQLNYVTIL